MGDLIVKPSYQFSERDILTVDKLNLLATPVVELALTDPVNDQNFFRNGNFYSSFWTDPTGVSCPDVTWTTNASYWLVRPNGGAANFLRSNVVPDIYSLFSGEVQGAINVGNLEFGQQINGDLAATLRRNCTFSGYIFNGSGLVMSGVLNFYTADAFNNFGSITLQTTVNIQSAANASWTFLTATLDLSSLQNVANGLMVAIWLPAGSLNDPSKYVLFSRLKFQIGEVATEFVDDPSLFLQAPSVDATMLQDGCIARSSLFMPNVIPMGAYQAKSINNGDINDEAVDGRTMVQNAQTTLAAGFTQPSVGATVSITVNSASGFVPPETVSIAGAGYYSITSVTDATHMVIYNAGSAGNVSPGTAVPSGGVVSQTCATITNLGYTPINKAGDNNIGPGTLQFVNDDVIGTTSFFYGAIYVGSSTGNASNAGYMPAIGFGRPGVAGRAIGLATSGRLLAPVSGNATQYYLLDNYFGVANADIQAGAITYDKLSQNLINLICPIGMVVPFAGVTPPGGWAICDGSAVSRTTYATLFAQLGTYWGVGDGVSTFNIPNFINRVPVGGGSGGYWGFGTYGGEASHQLSIAEMPGHDHGYSQSPHGHGTHFHNVNGVVGIGAGNTWASGSGWAGGGATTDAQSVPAANANINFVGQGGSAAHNNMPPYGVLYYLIKVI